MILLDYFFMLNITIFFYFFLPCSFTCHNMKNNVFDELFFNDISFYEENNSILFNNCSLLKNCTSSVS